MALSEQGQIKQLLKLPKDIEANTSLDDAQNTQVLSEQTELALVLKQRQECGSSLWPTCIVMILGLIFGFCFNKSRVFEPASIVEQMLFKKFIMLKFFLSAAGTSTLCMVVTSHFYPQHFAVIRSNKKYAVTIGSVIVTSLGAFVIGIGMSVAGSCPGTVYAQMGAGVPNSYLTFAGLFSGAFIFGITEPCWQTMTKQIANQNSSSYTFLDRYFEKISYTMIATGFGIFCWIIVGVIEFFWSWTSDLTVKNLDCTLLTCGSWPPWISGLFVGCLQMPLISVLGSTVGSSSSYVCITSQWMRCVPQSVATPSHLQNAFTRFAAQLNRWWQVVFLLCALFGSWVAVLVTVESMKEMNVFKYPFDGIDGYNELRSFFGGMLLIIGARMAKGCPSGHGFSGFARMSILSIIFAIPFMFAGGIITAFLFYN